MNKKIVYSIVSLVGMVASFGIDANMNSMRRFGQTKVVVMQGDITKQGKVDAIVNAANDELQHNGGVARAISVAAGTEMQSYCNTITLDADGKRCKVGNAVVTDAFNLRKNGIKKIIHAVGPDCRIKEQNKNKEKLLKKTYINILKVAQKNNIRTLAMPAISTAIFGYNIKDATPIAIATVTDFIEKNPNSFDEIRFVLFTPRDSRATQEAFDIYNNCLKNRS